MSSICHCDFGLRSMAIVVTLEINDVKKVQKIHNLVRNTKAQKEINRQ